MSQKSPIQLQFEQLAKEIMTRYANDLKYYSLPSLRITTIQNMRKELLELKQTYTEMFGESAITTDAQFYEVIGLELQ